MNLSNDARKALLAAADAFVKGYHGDDAEYPVRENELIYAAAQTKKAVTEYLRASAKEEGGTFDRYGASAYFTTGKE